MKHIIIILSFFTFYIWSCDTGPENPEYHSIPSIRFKITDENHNDLIKGSFNNRIEFFYFGNSGKQKLSYFLYGNDTIPHIVDVDSIPELSSQGIKKFYFVFNDYPVATLYIDILKKAFYPSQWYEKISYQYDFKELRCNGHLMEYDERNVLYYIKN